MKSEQLNSFCEKRCGNPAFRDDCTKPDVSAESVESAGYSFKTTAEKERLRLFIAVDVDIQSIRHIQESSSLLNLLDELRRCGNNLRVVRPCNLHITLKFLGDTSAALLPIICRAIEESTAGTSVFVIRLSGMGAFPSMNSVRVVWVGVDGAEPMSAISLNLDKSLAKIGVKPEVRPFSPHLTVARAAGGHGAMSAVRDIIDKNAHRYFGEIIVDKIHLKKSTLAPNGPLYDTIYTVTL